MEERIVTVMDRYMAGIAAADATAMRQAAQEIFAENCEFRRPPGENGQQAYVGYDAFAPYLVAIVTALRPISGEVLESFTDGAGRTCSLTRIRGVHSGTFELPGIDAVPATGKPVSYEELTITETAAGRITRQFSYYDLKSLLRQIGAQ